MIRTIGRLPFLKFVAVVQLALLARRHLSALSPQERRRMAELTRHAHRLDQRERQELVNLALKLEPRAFAGAFADRVSPFPLPKRVVRGPSKNGRYGSRGAAGNASGRTR